MNTACFLHGIKIKNFRGFGPAEQTLAPFKTFNFFIGANNAGKSSVLSLIEKYLPIPPWNTIESTQMESSEIDLLDIYKKGHCDIHISTGVPKDQIIDRLSHEFIEQDCLSKQDFLSKIDEILRSISDQNMIWFSSKIPYTHPTILPALNEKPEYIKSIINNLSKRIFLLALDNNAKPPTSPIDNEVILNKLLEKINFQTPSVCLIPAIREIGEKGSIFDNSGKGLIDRLAEIQNPDHDKLDDRHTFEKINCFVAEVTGIRTAKIEIPHDRKHILVRTDEITLPIQSLGTGIHEVIILASLCTLNTNKIVCIEEPELHLHPLLQKKFIRYLQENTDNQYFISTHSSSFIDTPDAAIFQISHDGTQTIVKQSVTNQDKFEICMELGYKASDLLQTNAVIWVEGPSDRIYIKHWLKMIEPDFVEGIHYSIMFYGGRLLSHLSANDDETVNNFISLRKLNRHIALVMDSDKDSEDDAINATKRRLIDEFAQDGGVAWLTRGREIENYIESNTLQTAVQSVYKDSYDSPSNTGQFDHPLFFYRKTKENKIEEFKDVDKVKVAHEVCKNDTFVDHLDLKIRIDELVELIKKANA